jgi:hypothetical protein
MSGGRLCRLCILILQIGLVGCAYRALEHGSSAGLEWPAGDPRVRLQTVIELDEGKDSAGLRILKWLGADEVGRRFRRPYGVAWHGDAVLIADPDAALIARIAPGGKIQFSPAGLFDQPIGVASCPQGIVATDAVAGRVALLDDDLRLVRWLSEELLRPTGVSCSDERTFVLETGRHRLVVIEPDGTRTILGGRGDGRLEFNYPSSIVVHEGFFLVGDTLNFRVQRLDVATGAYEAEFGRLGDAPGETPRIKGLAVDRDGNIWVSDAHLDRVSLYDAKGELLISLGGNGIEEGRFSFPAGIAAHADGRVAVVDSLNRRLQVFNLLTQEGSATR